MCELGFEAALMIDNDGGSAPADIEAATAAGCMLLQWDPGSDLERQLSSDLSSDGLQAIIDLAVEVNKSADPSQSVRSAVAARVGEPALPSGTDVADWTSACGVGAVRMAIAGAASSAGWFKSETNGRLLGRLVLDLRAELADSRLKSVLNALQTFTHPSPQ